MGNGTGKLRIQRPARPAPLGPGLAPTDLYPSCPWDPHAASKLILAGRLAPRAKGREDAGGGASCEECPICFLFLEELNRTRCCRKPICTECFLQLRPPDRDADCPFCTKAAFAVQYEGPRPEAERASALLEERKAEAGRLRRRAETPGEAASPEAPTDLRTVPVSARRELERRVRDQNPTTPRRAAADPGAARRAPTGLESLLRGLGRSDREVLHVEEMMLLEAMRRSLHDAAPAAAPRELRAERPRGREREANAEENAARLARRSARRAQREVAMAAARADEERMLAMAIALSLAEGGGEGEGEGEGEAGRPEEAKGASEEAKSAPEGENAAADGDEEEKMEEGDGPGDGKEAAPQQAKDADPGSQRDGARGAAEVPDDAVA